MLAVSLFSFKFTQSHMVAWFVLLRCMFSKLFEHDVQLQDINNSSFRDCLVFTLMHCNLVILFLGQVETGSWCVG